MTTFAKQACIYLRRIAKRKRNPVKRTSRATIKSLIRAAGPVIGQMELEDIRSGALKTLAAALDDQRYSPNTIQSVLTTVKMIVASDVDENGEPKHPRKWNAEYIDALPVRSKKVRVPTPAEIETALTNTSGPMWQFMATQAATGMRKGELCALRVSDFDREIGLLRVSRTLSRFGETATKTENGKREVDIAPETTAMLVAMLAERTSTTTRLFDVTLSEVRYAYEKAGLKSHSLRHWRYTILQKAKIHPAIHTYWIGHSAKGMSAIYGHIHEDVELRQRLVREVGLGFALPAVSTPAEIAEAVSA